MRSFVDALMLFVSGNGFLVNELNIRLSLQQMTSGSSGVYDDSEGSMLG